MSPLKTALLFIVLSILPACSSGGSTGGGGGGSGGAAGGTGGGAAATEPTIASTSPTNLAIRVALNVRISATFSIPMDPLTVSTTTFTVKQGTNTVAGAVVYAGSTATFTPTANLAANTTFTAAISTGAKSASGRAIASVYTWTFVTGTTTAIGPTPVGLGAAGTYVVLAKTAISTVPSSKVTGSVGLSPAAATFVTGFSLVADATNVFSTSPQVIGKIYAANYAAPSPSNLTTAISNMESAYTDAAGRPTPDFLELGTGTIGGLTLAPGLYKWTSTISIPTNVTIAGGANDVWIFQTTGDVTMTAATRITLSGGAQAKNIFWQVAGKVTLGANSKFEGVILCKTEITLQTGASLNGRLLAQSQIALQQATVTQPADQ